MRLFFFSSKVRNPRRQGRTTDILMRGRRRAEHVRDARFSRERSEFHDFVSILSIQNFSYVFVHFWKHPKCIAFELWTTIVTMT